MKAIKFLLPALTLVAGMIVGTTASYGKAEYAKKEKKACAFCHVKMGSKDLNDAGKYYKEHKSLEGYKAKK